LRIAEALIYYYKAYYYGKSGEHGKARDLLEKASEVSPKYCFPYRLETFPVLEWALSERPDDAQAHYLLGNLLKKSRRPEEAVAHWEKSIQIDPMNAVAQRNLGQAYHEQGDLYKAMAAYRAAIKADPSAGRAIVELGMINREAELPLDEQMALFEDNIEVVREYNQAASQLILLYIMTGRNAEALSLLNTIHFNSWEGQYGIHQLWIQGNIKQGDGEFEKGNYAEALRYYEQSMLYPDHLEVAEQPNTIHARKRFKIGAALEALGRKAEAREYFEMVISDTVEAGNAYQYYRARAMERMGRKKEAKQVYGQMLEALNENRNASSSAVSLFSRSLAREGLGQSKEAEADRSEAHQMNPLVEISAFRPPRSGF
jgi:tetratricopeptide (TPR) repeat protein